MKKFTLAALLACAAALATATSALAVGGLADVHVYDRMEGRYLPVYQHDGRYYVVGRPGNEYQVVLRNNTGERVLAVTSVDGVNVITGESAAPEQSGYILDRFATTNVAGWRKSLSRTAAFYFTALEDSYAARTGRPWDVGVIGVALYRERMPIAYPDYDYGPGWKERAKSRAGAAQGGVAPRAQEKSLGTGHGRHEWSPASYGSFERLSSQPDEIVAIYYDSYADLVAQGVIHEGPYYARRGPNPFPNGFVADPRW